MFPEIGFKVENMKKILALLVSLGLLVTISGCTSKKSHKDQVAATDEAGPPGEGLEAVDAGGAQKPAGGDEAAAGFLDEQLPEETVANNQPPAELAFPDQNQNAQPDAN